MPSETSTKSGDIVQTHALSLIDFQAQFTNFCVIDIRSKLAFANAHITHSLSLQNMRQVLDYLQAQSSKPILFVCYSSYKAKQFALDFQKNLMANNLKNLYPHSAIYYLDCSIFALLDSTIPIVETQETIEYALSLPQHNIKTQENIDKTKEITSHSIITQTQNDLKEKFLNSTKTFVITFSGGKDSTCVLQLFYEMLLNLPKAQRRPSFAIASNTLVEAPHIEKFLKSVINSINTHAKENNIPFKIIEVSPSLKDDFWVNLIGKGYPSPTRTFRWCTDRLKITPAKAEVAKLTHKYGSVILCLGTREAESNNRKKSMQKRILNEDGYSQHHEFPNTMTYSPIAKWRTDDVWSYLATHKPKWQKDHSELFALYSKASGDECQFITDLSQSSCGGSRFGCWVCTVVSEDKSMQGFIESGDLHLKPLNEFRNYLKALRENPNARADYKRDGRAVYRVGGLGPFLSSVRKDIFYKLLETENSFKQNNTGYLITDLQIKAIQAEWDKDFDMCKSAIRIAQQFHRLQEETMADNKILHPELLEEVANQDVSFENLSNLVNRSIEIFNTSGLKGKNNAQMQIKDEIAKLLDDKSAKLGE